jgi:hypothetical protein
MTTAAPERSLIQRKDALVKANDIRIRRARLKKDLKARRINVVNLITDPPAFIETMKLFDLIIATPKYGRVKANKILGFCRVSPSKTIGGLSERQRSEIAAQLRH